MTASDRATLDARDALGARDARDTREGRASDRHAEALRAATLAFTDAFNRNDLDAVMAYFADDAIYEQVDGTVSTGKAAIRAAFEPQFRGDFGAIRFEIEDAFVDAAAEKSLVRWICRLERDGRSRSWRGLDVLNFRAGQVFEKHTYGKAERLRLAEAAGGGAGKEMP